jgi:hypothetical protein
VVEAWSRGLVVTKDQVGVEKGDAYLVEATKVGFEVENEGTKVVAPKEIDHDTKEGGEATNVVHDGGPPQGEGDDHGLEFIDQYNIDLALPWDAQTQLIKDTTLPLVAKT